MEIFRRMRKADPIQQRHFMRQVIEKIELKRSGEIVIVWKFSEVLTAVEEMVGPTVRPET